MRHILRKPELSKLSVLKDKNLVNVLTVLRRSGKSTLLIQCQELLKEVYPNVAIVSVNMDLPEFRIFADNNWKEIYDYINRLLQKDGMNYVFIEENPNLSIISVNMDLPEFRFFAENNWKEIYAYINRMFQKDGMNYVVID